MPMPDISVILQKIACPFENGDYMKKKTGIAALFCILAVCIGCQAGSLNIEHDYPDDHPQGAIIDITLSKSTSLLTTKRAVEQGLVRRLSDLDVKIVSRNLHHIRLKAKFSLKYLGKKTSGLFLAHAYATNITLTVRETEMVETRPLPRKKALDLGPEAVTHYLEKFLETREDWEFQPAVTYEDGVIRIVSEAIRFERDDAKTDSMKYALKDFNLLAAKIIKASIPQPRVPVRTTGVGPKKTPEDETTPAPVVEENQ